MSHFPDIPIRHINCQSNGDVLVKREWYTLSGAHQSHQSHQFDGLLTLSACLGVLTKRKEISLNKHCIERKLRVLFDAEEWQKSMMIFYRLLLITIDYYRLLSILLIDNNRQIIYSVTSISIDFRNQSIIIGGLKPLISMISIDFQYRFLSINYVRRNNTNDFKISTNCEQVPLNIDHKTSQITYWKIYWICPEPENALSDDITCS